MTSLDPEPVARPAPTSPSRDNAAWQRADRSVLWHPFTQMRGWMSEDFPVIVAADGCELIDADGRRYLDGTSSLWCALHGHRVPEVDEAVRAQLDKVAHSTLLGLGGEASIGLAEELVDALGPPFSRVFYSDSGSTAVEIGLKMAFQCWRQREGNDTRRRRFLCLQDAYHGDTIGSVSVGGIDLFHAIFHPLLFSTDRIPVPVGPSARARELDVPRCLAALDEHLAARGDEYAAVVLEPGVQGAAGIRVFPEGFTRAIVERCRAAGMLVIVDEVATGFGRAGNELFASRREGVVPDIIALAKGLSAGYLPLAATVATEAIYESFLGDYADFRTFFHGHTFTGNPLACAAGRASLALCRAPDFLPRVTRVGDRIAAGLDAALADHPHVLEIRRYGAMFGVELVARRGEVDERGVVADLEPFAVERRTGHRVTEHARTLGAIVRPLGDTVVLMPPFALDDAQADRLVDVTVRAIDAAVQDG